MTGRQKIESAFSKDGTDEIPAVICYEGIYIRDHWKQLTSYPWWYREVPDIKRQILWRRDIIEKTGQDWFRLPYFYSSDEQKNLSIEVREKGIFRVDRRSGKEVKLSKPRIGGWLVSDKPQSVHPDYIAETPEEIDVLIPIPSEYSLDRIKLDGRDVLAAEMLSEFGQELYPICHVSSPLWCCYGLWGFEGMMTLVATKPEMVKYACHRFLTLNLISVRKAALLGAAGIWIEECLTDQISPQAFKSINLPFLSRLIQEIRALNLNSIYYFCGNPEGKWRHILSVDADALAFEESKKDFVIDIEDVVDRVQGKFTVLGNLDALNLLENGTEEQLRSEISRQIAAGRRNRSRFIMNIGSPVTPRTSVKRVRKYCDLVHEIGT